MTRIIASLEFLGWVRNKRILSLLVLSAIALSGVTIWGVWSDIAQREAHQAAALAARAQWEGRGAANPHQMAHFGDFVFRPSGSLSRLDRGVEAHLGKVLRVEGHGQDMPLHADSSRAGTVARFARLDAAFLLQTVVPLLLIFLGATGLASDREQGRLKLALSQGASARGILSGHFFALWLLGIGLLAVVTISSVATSGALSAESVIPTDRLAAFVLVHALFLGIIAAGVVVSIVLMRSAKSALLALLAIWVLGTAMLPQAAAGMAGVMFPLPSRDEFDSAMRASREAGPDGHNPQDAELARLREAAMKEHNVARVEDLPFNFDGIAMQVDEEFGNRVWDEHFGDLRAQLARQTSFASLASIANPFQAIDRASMAIAGTDLAHDIAFQRQAEAHRRDLVERLNHEHAYGGSKTGDWSWRATPEFFAALSQFRFDPPTLASSAPGPEIVGMLAWLAVLFSAFGVAARRLERGQLRC